MNTEAFESLIYYLGSIPFLVDSVIYKYTSGNAGEDVHNELEFDEELKILGEKISNTHFIDFERELLYNLQDFNKNPKVLANYYISFILDKKLNEIYEYIKCDEEEIALIFIYSNNIPEQISALRYIFKKRSKLSIPLKLFHAQAIIYYAESVYNDIIKFIYDKFLVIGYDFIQEFIQNNMCFYSYDENENFDKALIIKPISINQTIELTLPKELDTPRAKECYKKAIAKGYITINGEHFIRNSKSISKALLAYLTEKIHCENISSSYPETALNKLFNETRLGKARSQYVNNKNLEGKPKGFEIIDELF